MNIYDILSLIMTIGIMIMCASMILVLMYACIMRVVHGVRVHDRAVCVRTHGDVVRTPAYMATCESLVYMLMEDEYTMDMTA